MRLKPKQYNLKVGTSILILCLLLGFTALFVFAPQAKAQSAYVLVFSVSPANSGTISWVDLTEPYHNGATTTNYTEVFASQDILEVTATPNAGNIVVAGDIFTYSSASETGEINENPLTTTPIIEAFNLTANFKLPANPTVTVNAADGGTVMWGDLTEPYHNGGVTNGIGTEQIVAGDTLGFEAYPSNASTYFGYWIISGWINDTENTNPLTLTDISSSVTVTAHWMISNVAHITIEATTGNYVQWVDNTGPYYDGLTNNTQTVDFPLNDNITFYCWSDSGYQFLNWVISNNGNSTNNPYNTLATSNFVITAYTSLSPTPTKAPTSPPWYDNPLAAFLNYLEHLPPITAAILTLIGIFALIFGTGALGFILMKQYGALIGINIGLVFGYAIPLYWGYTFVPLFAVVIILVVDAIYVVAKVL